MKPIVVIFMIVISNNLWAQNDLTRIRDSIIIDYGNTYYNEYLTEKENATLDRNSKINIENRTKKINNIYVLDENNYPIELELSNSKIKFKSIDLFSRKNNKKVKKGIIPIVF